MLLTRWQELTRITLPSMARANSWPIWHDHCFMRVCLDTVVRDRWDMVVRRPAIHHLTDSQLAAAIAVAQGIVDDPTRLAPLNAASLLYRRKAGGGGC